jgi:hypothetical protein
MLEYSLVVLLIVSVNCAENSGDSSASASSNSQSLPAGLTSLTGLGGSYSAFQKQILASQPPEKTFTLRAGESLPAHYGTPQVISSSADHQELVVQHPQPRRVLVRVVKPIIFEERIVIVPYRRVTHEVRPVIEERHTVIYGKDGKQISGPVGDKSGYGPIASGSDANSRVVAQPVYAEPIIRKNGQNLSKRSSIDYSGSRPNPLENRRSMRDRLLNQRAQANRA